MDAPIAEACQNLSQSLRELISSHEELFFSLQAEKKFLIHSDIADLSENNRAKETLLSRIKNADQQREKQALRLAFLLKLKPDQARLLELAKHVDASHGQFFSQCHRELSVVINNVTELNRENEVYAKSALSTLNKALNNVKETLGGKRTYANKGKAKDGPMQAGNFVSKEA